MSDHGRDLVSQECMLLQHVRSLCILRPNLCINSSPHTAASCSVMPSLLSRLGRLRELTSILDRPKGVKSRLGLSRSGFPEWKIIELWEDILRGDVPAPSDQLRSEADSAGKEPQCHLAVIRSEEL